MRIFHIDRQRRWGGQIGRLYREANGAHEAGHEVGVVASPGSALADRARAAGWDVITLPMRGWRSNPAILHLAAALRARQVDILHAHGARDHLMATVAAPLAGVKALIRNKHNHTRLRHGAFSRLPYNRCARVVAISEFVRELLIEDGISPDHVMTIQTSIDLERFTPRPRNEELMRELGLTPDDIIVGNLSSLHRRKGIDTLLHAFKLMQGAPYANRLKCVFIGKRWEQWVPLAQELGIADRVVFKGFTDDVPDALSVFDVYFAASREEGLGTAVLEAMAMQRPVVVSRVGGLCESVTPETGVHVEPDDAAGFAAAARAIIEDPERARAMGEAGRGRVQEHYSVKTMVRRMLDLYEDVLQNGRRRKALL